MFSGLPQMTSIFVVTITVAFLTLQSSNAAQSKSAASISARLRLEPLVQIFTSPRDVGVWVIVENQGQHCRTVMLDQTVAAFPSTSRPYTFVKLEVRDSQGGLLKMEHEHFGLRATFAPADLLTLRCPSLHGWMIPLGVGPWSHPLRPGKYSVRARLTNDVRAFFDANPAELRVLARATGMDQQGLKELLTDFSIDSGEVSFEVTSPAP